MTIITWVLTIIKIKNWRSFVFIYFYDKLLIDQTDKHNRIYEIKTKSCGDKIDDFITLVFSHLHPFRLEIENFSKQYDRNIIVFFDFSRAMLTSSLLFLLCYIYLLVNHFILYKASAWPNICKYMAPCVLLYSQFKESEGEILVYSFIAGVLFVFYYSLRKTIHYERRKFERELYRNFESPLANSLFNFWWWNIDTQIKSNEEIQRLIYKFTLKIEEKAQK